MTISKEDSHLIVLTPDNAKLTLHAETERDFYVKGQFLFIHFKQDNSGKIVGVQVEQFGGEEFVKKVN